MLTISLASRCFRGSKQSYRCTRNTINVWWRIHWMTSMRRTHVHENNTIQVYRCNVYSWWCDGLYRPAEYLADATMRDTKLPGDVTRTYTVSRHLHNPLTHHVRQRTSINEHSSQLVNPTMTYTHPYTVGYNYRGQAEGWLRVLATALVR